MDTFWEEVVSHVKGRSPDGSRYGAPQPFKDSLKGIVPYSEITNCDLDEVSGLVIHKGLYEEIDASFLYQMLQRTVPTFANAVFIVLEVKGTRLPSRYEHLGSLSQIKQWAAMKADPSIERPVEKLIDESGQGDDAILTPMVNFIVDNLVKVIDPSQTKPVIAIAETAERFNDTSWFWVDDTGKTAELFAVPKVRDAHPALADAMVDYVVRLSPDGIIHRRAAVPELKLVSSDPERFQAFNGFFKLTGDLTKGVICPSIRYNDDRARLVGQYCGNLIRFGYKGRQHAVNIKSSIKKWAVDEHADRIVFSHSSEIRARPLIGKTTRVCDVTCKYTLWRARPTLEMSVTVTAAPGVTLEDVQLSTALDQLSSEGGFQTAIVGQGDEFQSHTARIKERVTLRSGPADYLCLYEAGCIPGFAHGLHIHFKDGSKLKEIIAGGNFLKDIARRPSRWVSSKLKDVSGGKLKGILAEGPSAAINYDWVYARYGLGDLRGGETASIVEDRLLTGGGYYNKPQIYRQLMIAAKTGTGEVDPSVSYDVGAELNAVAVTLLFAKLGLYRISPPSAERLASLKAWFDRHLNTYLEVVRPGEAGEQIRVFVRGLSFMILSLDCMARAYPDGGYQAKLQTCVQIMLRLEEPVRGGMEESFFGPPFGPPELDCQVSALLALARAAFWGDPDRRISAAMRRALRAISPACAYSDPGGQNAFFYDSLLFRKEVGATTLDTGFWSFKCGLALRAFNAVLQMQRLGFLFLDQDTLNHLEVLNAIARLALKPSMQWEAGKLEALTSQKSTETNSETQPWVALGLAPAIEWTILGKATSIPLTNQSFAVGSPPQLVAYFDPAAPPMPVEWECSEPQAIQMLNRVAEIWQGLGESKPHWSVLSNDQYLPSNIADSEQSFFASGEHDRNRLVATIRRVGRDPATFKVAHEFGCGLGRLTNYLSESFERVIACDVSRSHLEFARARSAKIGRTNIDYRVARLPTFGMDDPFDLWFSIIVLQHNPPPIMAMVLRRALSLLRPGGLAVFQIPTYSPNYHFKIDGYLASPVPALGVEMHFLPQSALFKLVHGAGCSLLEITHDGTIGAKECLSNLVVITK
jgi:SAM-dependent methyltransferase